MKRIAPKKRLCFVLAGGFLGLLAFASPPARADEDFVSSPHNCGLYCMYAIFQWYGVEADIESLIQPKYLSSASGSTFADLARLAHEYGLQTRAMKSLNLSSLRATRVPIILNVRSSLEQAPFDHYVVVFPTEDRRPVAYDPTRNTTVPLNTLTAGYWNGYGITISQEPVGLTDVFSGDYVYMLIGIPALLLVRWVIFPGRKKASKASARRLAATASSALIILCVTIALALVSEGVWRESPQLAQGPVVQAVQGWHAGSFLSKLSAEDVNRAIDAGDLIIDARMEPDYNAGHIPGAINLGVAGSEEDYAQALRDVPKETHIVVYCQSASCPYAGQVAKKLWETGYTNVGLYKPGWVEWEALSNEGEAASE
ncbi:MAG: hypothetical protein JXR94_16040 [Candidatus Hydrogenedentes bacterium]|nr:hypothetical protein [Candidatus Hydrogenedentota bacterium]